MDIVLTKIMGTVTPSGVTWREAEFPFTETANSYIRAKTNEYPGKRLAKTSVMKLDSLFLQSSGHVNFHIWCFPEDKAEAQTRIAIALEKEVQRMWNDLHAMMEAINNPAPTE